MRLQPQALHSKPSIVYEANIEGAISMRFLGYFCLKNRMDIAPSFLKPLDNVCCLRPQARLAKGRCNQFRAMPK
jgi:hypothetical protein